MKPILFNTEMVRAILSGRKTATRRVVKPQPRNNCHADAVSNLRDRPVEFFNLSWISEKECNEWACGVCGAGIDTDGHSAYKSAYVVGDTLYIREAFAQLHPAGTDGYTAWDEKVTVYRADGTPITRYDAAGLEEDGQKIKWKPSIHMPRELARIFLKVTDVRLERLQDIELTDCGKEGMKIEAGEPLGTRINHKALSSFSKLWDSTLVKADADKYKWDSNPWVWVYEFEVSEVLV